MYLRHFAFTRRLFPALAGNTLSALIGRRRSPVHPRAGGEHVEASLDVDPYDGSSPRRRGTHDEVRSDRALRRFIPAQAGNTTVAWAPRH